jgi:hypothetical protein
MSAGLKTKVRSGNGGNIWRCRLVMDEVRASRTLQRPVLSAQVFFVITFLLCFRFSLSSKIFLWSSSRHIICYKAYVVVKNAP